MEIILVIIKYIIYAIWVTKSKSIANDIKDIEYRVREYEDYSKTIKYCLENDYLFKMTYFGMCINIRCIPSERNYCDYNIHISDFDPYITEMCIQLDESYVLAISPLQTFYDQEITEIWKYHRDRNSKFIVHIILDYCIGRLDYYKKLLKIRSKYGML